MSTVIDLGTLVGQRFIVEAKAGQGGMGTVFRARDILRGETPLAPRRRSATAGASRSCSLRNSGRRAAMR